MIHFTVPGIPPSANKAYFQNGRMRVLSAVGKKYKIEVKTYLAREHPEVLKAFRKNDPYSIIIVCNLQHDKIYMRSFPTSSPDRFIRWDVTNRIKLLEDAICEACGHDDRQHMFVTAGKKTTEGEPFTDVWAHNLFEEECPIERFINA